MIYLQQFNFKIEYKVGKKMFYVDYLSRLSVKYQMLYKLKEVREETFMSQVCLNQKAKYVIVFIYNAYRPWISVRTNQNKKIYGLH